MVKDVGWKVFFSDDERYADLLNGVGCGGEQVVKKEDLHDMDTQIWLLWKSKLKERINSWKKGSIKIRDTVRKVAFGMNFAIIGVENQEKLDYSIPIRSMSYDLGTYEKQVAKIRKEVRKNHVNLSAGEYLYGFCKDSRLYPVVTFVVYSGQEAWDGPMSLHEILDFAGIPPKLQAMVADYQINLIDIRRLEDTSVFRTDVKQVFDFIRCANDGKALRELVESDDYYKNMDEEAFDVAVQYTQAKELIEAKEYLEKNGGIDMCKGLKDLIAEGQAEGQALERVNTERERKRAEEAEAEIERLREELARMKEQAQ